MPASTRQETTLGQKLRRQRKHVGKTLQTVAQETGLSIAFLSQIERGLSSPSLASLKLIAGAVGVGVETLVRSPIKSGPVSRHGARQTYATGSTGPSYERLSDEFPGSALNSVIITLPPRYLSQESVHEGEEIMFVLSGQVLCSVDGDARLLESGDTIHFSSRLPHWTENPADIPARVLWVGTLQIFNDDPLTTRSRGGTALHPTGPGHDVAGAQGFNEGE